MIDIVCPSCQARYRLPDGSIGEQGRRVSCSACGHAWLAHPEPQEDETLTLGPEAVAETAEAGAGAPGGGAGAPGGASAPGGGRGADAPDGAGAPGGGGGAAVQRTPEREAPKPAAAPAAEPARRPAAAEAKTFNPYKAYDSDDVASGTSPYGDEEDRGMAAYKAFAASQDDDDAPKEDAAALSASDFSASAATDRLADDRAKQMSQIRAMLSEIKESTPGPKAKGGKAKAVPQDDDEDEKTSEPPPPPRPNVVERTMRELENEERDPLREKLEQYKRPGGKMGDVRAAQKKMLKKHAKKVRRRKLEEKKGSGTGLTALLLIVFVISIMATVYLLHPLIIAKVPEAEPAIRDYVATMDQVTAWIGNQIDAAAAWLNAIIEGK